MAAKKPITAKIIGVFEDDFDTAEFENENANVQFELRKQTFSCVPQLTFADQAKLQKGLSENQITSMDFFDMVLLSEDDRERFWALCELRENPVRNSTIEGIVKALMETYTGQPSPKENG